MTWMTPAYELPPKGKPVIGLWEFIGGRPIRSLMFVACSYEIENEQVTDEHWHIPGLPSRRIDAPTWWTYSPIRDHE